METLRQAKTKQTTSKQKDGGLSAALRAIAIAKKETANGTIKELKGSLLDLIN